MHLLRLRRAGAATIASSTGWAIVAAALVSPLCALSVSLISARVAQHVVLLLVAAPLIANGRGARR